MNSVPHPSQVARKPPSRRFKRTVTTSPLSWRCWMAGYSATYTVRIGRLASLRADPVSIEPIAHVPADCHDAAVPPANRLARETSPYLLQHAHNPVDWYPWGDEAFA